MHDSLLKKLDLGTNTLVDEDIMCGDQRHDLDIGGEQNPIGESFTDRPLADVILDELLGELACENVGWDDLPRIQDIHHGLLHRLAMGAEYFVDEKSKLTTEILGEIALRHDNSVSLFFELYVEVVHEYSRQSEKPTTISACVALKLAGCKGMPPQSYMGRDVS